MNYRFAFCFAALSVASLVACSAAPSSSVGTVAQHDDRGDDDDSSGDQESVDPSYVGDWVVAPGSKGDFTKLSLHEDGTYVRTVASTTRAAKAETGTWTVLFHSDWDWIWVHELHLVAAGANSTTTMYGAEVSTSAGYGEMYPNGEQPSFVVLPQSIADAIPSTCDFEHPNCAPNGQTGKGELGDVLACIPAESDATAGTCTANQNGCFPESGCTDRAAMCVAGHGAIEGFCVPRSADVPSCDVQKQDCADPSLVCMPFEASEATGFCQRFYQPCRTTQDCSLFGAACVTPSGDASRSFCVRQAH